MPSESVVARLCRLPKDHLARSLSPVALVVASGYLNSPYVLTRQAILEELHNNPNCVDDWELYSENQRCDGWVFRTEGDLFEVYRQTTEGAVEVDVNTWQGGHTLIHEHFTFDDRMKACAEYVVREVLALSELAKR